MSPNSSSATTRWLSPNADGAFTPHATTTLTRHEQRASTLCVTSPPINSVLQLLERQEDQNRRRLQPHPCGDPSFEHEHWTFVFYRDPDGLQRRRRAWR